MIDIPFEQAARPARRLTQMSVALVCGLVAAIGFPATTAKATPGGIDRSFVAQAMGDGVGMISADIDRGGTPRGSDLGVESDIGNLVADAQLFAVREDGIAADFAFVHPGSLRADLEFDASGSEETDGIVTFEEAFTLQPFNSTIFVLPLTGTQIEAALVEQCQRSDSEAPVLQLGVSNGVTYGLDITKQAGVCTAVDVSNIRVDGADLVATQTYRVAMNNFLSTGGAGSFATFTEVAPQDRVQTDTQETSALLSYFEAEGIVDPPGTDRVEETITTLPTPPTALAPVRLLESRTGDDFTTIDGLFEGIGRLDAGDTVELDVRSRGGVRSDATSVDLQVGAIFPDGGGYLTVYPCSAERPIASSINFNGADVVSNAVTSLIGDGGKVCIFTLKDTDLYIDVNGYGSPPASPVAITPARYLDDRAFGNDGTFDDRFVGGGPLRADSTLELEVAGRGLVPVDTKAVLLNVVAASPTGSGFLSVFPCDRDLAGRPSTSNVNYVSGSDFANGVTTGVGDDGNVCIYTSADTNVVVDVNGYVPVDGTPDPVTPFRLVDTRIGDDFTTVDGERQGEGAFDAGETIEVQIAGRNGIPDDATSAYLNVAAVDARASGYLTVFPCADEVPNASNVNYGTGDTVANSVRTPLTDDGTVCVFSIRETDFIMDINGFIVPIVPARPAVV